MTNLSSIEIDGHRLSIDTEIYDELYAEYWEVNELDEADWFFEYRHCFDEWVYDKITERDIPLKEMVEVAA